MNVSFNAKFKSKLLTTLALSILVFGSSVTSAEEAKAMSDFNVMNHPHLHPLMNRLDGW